MRVTRRQSECKVRRDHSCESRARASHDCDMLEPMYVRCAQCGYDNSPEFRFCGMCGGTLPHPPKEPSLPERDVVLPAVAAPDTPPLRIAPTASGGERIYGPSFLGLSNDQPSHGNYRNDDDEVDGDEDDAPKRGRAAGIALVLLLIAAVGFLGWQWGHGGFLFNRLSAGSNPQQSASPAAVPDTTQNSATQPADKSTTGGAGTPAAPDSGAATDSTAKSETPAQEATPASPNPDQSAPADKAVSAQASPPASAPVKSRTKRLDSTKTRAKSPGVETASLATSPDAQLEITGERYLYGTGLPQSCTRAESSLGTAAAHGNSKAETVLGTMYATGHCVGRDLPTAYRWFARALHQDPQNSRISADLQVLWRQMTPEEKQLATSVPR
jgi:hypothetical protein